MKKNNNMKSKFEVGKLYQVYFNYFINTFPTKVDNLVYLYLGKFSDDFEGVVEFEYEMFLTNEGKIEYCDFHNFFQFYILKEIQ